MNRSRTTTTRTIGIVILIALSSIALASCGGDDDSSADSSPSTELEVTLDSFLFDPADPTVVADAEVDVTVLNVDSNLEHTWVVLSAGNEITSEDEFDEGDVLFELTADAQRSAVGTLSVPAGEYQVICTVPGHFAAGMEGTVTAVAAGSGDA
jgi:plastocyanin